MVNQPIKLRFSAGKFALAIIIVAALAAWLSSAERDGVGEWSMNGGAALVAGLLVGWTPLRPYCGREF